MEKRNNLNVLSYGGVGGTSDTSQMCGQVNSGAGNSHGLSVPSLVNRVNAASNGVDTMLPRRRHQRSFSETPMGFSAVIQSFPQVMPNGRENLVSQKATQLVKRQSKGKGKNGGVKVEEMYGEIGDDFVSSYLNLDNIDTLNVSRKTNGVESSDKEVGNGANLTSMGFQGTSLSVSRVRMRGMKKSAGEDIDPTGKQSRSVSMDTYTEQHLNFNDNAARQTQQIQADQLSTDEKKAKLTKELKGRFNEADLKKILANDMLAQSALSDPKHVKRILVNRESAERSKLKRVKYVAELQQKIQTMETKLAELSAKATTDQL